MVKIHNYLITYLLATAAIRAGRSHAASLILHHTSFDGGLYWTCPIAKLQISDDLQFYISIYHETKYNSFENSIYSQWKIAGLETFLVRDDEDKLIWRSPTGDRVNFKINPSHNQEYIDSGGYQLMIESDDGYIVKDRESRRWSYKRGELARVSLKNGDEVFFKSKNGWINEIRKGDRIFLQTVQTDATLLLLINNQEVAAIRYDANRRLINSIAFGKSNRPPVQFTYENNNLKAIAEGDKTVQRFSWRKISFFDSWFTIIRYPSYLNSDGYYKYQHKFNFGVAHLFSTNIYGQEDEKIVNMKTGLIVDKKQVLPGFVWV